MLRRRAWSLRASRSSGRRRLRRRRPPGGSPGRGRSQWRRRLGGSANPAREYQVPLLCDGAGALGRPGRYNQCARSRTMAQEGLPMVPFLRDLLAHAEWANAVFFHAWGKSPARDHEELRSRVAHIIGVQEGFLSVLRGEPPGGPPDGPPPAFPDLKAWAETCHAGLIGFVRSLEPQALSQT